MKHYILLYILFLATSITDAQNINQFDANGKRHGIWKKYFENTNKLRYEGEFKHGKEVGIFNFYKLVKKRNVLSATKKFNETNNRAEVVFFSSYGSKLSEGQMIGKTYIGQWNYYHPNSSQLMISENYTETGLLHGKRLVYYKNGALAEAINYVNGKKQGASRWYAKNNTILKELSYKNDELHGLAKHFNTGELVVEGNYKNGKKVGLWSYYENGQLKEKKDFNYKRKTKTKPKQ